MDRQEYSELYLSRNDLVIEHMNYCNHSTEQMLELIYRQNDLILHWLNSLTRELCEIKDEP